MEKLVIDWAVTDIRRPGGRPLTRCCDEVYKLTERLRWKLEAWDRNERKGLGGAYVMQ